MKRIIWGNILLLCLLLSANVSMAANPIAQPQSVTVTANSSITITLQGSDTDGDTITSFGILSPPLEGTLLPTQQSPLPSNTVTYTPRVGFTGTDSFTFWVLDATGASSNGATVNITVKEDDFLLTFVTATLIPIIKQKQDQEEAERLQNYINNLSLTDATLRSCFPGSVPQGSALYNLTTLTCDKGIDLSAPSVMEDLGKLVNLETLKLPYSKLPDISALSGLTKLKELDLEFNNLTDASVNALSQMINLEKLNLRFNNLTTTSFLSGMNKLEELHLEANEITDIIYLTGKTTLKKLWLDDNNFTDISPLSNLTNLTHLGLGYNRNPANNNAISDISHLKDLSKLQVLVMDGNDITAHLTSGTGALTQMAFLEELYLRGNNIEVLGSNSLFPTESTYNQRLWESLELLALGFNNIENISILSSFVNLTHLGLEYNQIKDASALYGLSGLRHLTLDYNQIRETTSITGFGLNSLSGLNAHLNLRGNLLLDITPLTNMTNGFTLLADDNCLGSIVLPSSSTIKAFGKDWQFAAYPRCDDPTKGEKPLAYAQQVSTYQAVAKNITLSGADPDGDATTYEIVSQPTAGTISSFSASAGTLLYTPNTNHIGTDSITFRVKETSGLQQTSNTATVQISVLPTSLISDQALQSCFNGSVPNNTALQNLTNFSCEGKNLSSADISQLGNLPLLTWVRLKDASLTDAAISNLNNIGASWTFLDLSKNNITNISSALFNNKGNLATLGLEDNQLANISVLSGVTTLVEVYADGNDIVGSGLPSLSNLNNLSLLTLRYSRLKTADLESAWGSATSGANLVVHLNQNCLVSKPVLPSRINIQPVDAAGAITGQRPLSGTECPTL